LTRRRGSETFRSLRHALFLVVLTVLVAAPPAAAGPPVALGGSPLNVHVGERGQLQAFRTDRSESPGIFYESGNPTGDAGFFLAFPGGQVYGFETTAAGASLTDYTAESQGAVTGTSTLQQITVYSAPGLARVTQTTTYVNGAQQFRIHWAVANLSGAELDFKALAAADFFFDGSDRGTGVYTVGPPQFVGGTNADTGNSGGFEEVPGFGWSAYEALAYGPNPDQVWGKVGAAADTTGATLGNTVVGDQVDNAGAVEWDQHAATGLAANQTAHFELIARSAVPAALMLTPSNAGGPQAVPVTITARATDTAGVPYAGRTLRYSILGANASTGEATLGPDGSAGIVDPGTNAGADTIVAFVDFNGSGTREAIEPQASALVTIVDGIAPACTVKVTGDRPGGGGAGKPLVIAVSCGEGATVTVRTTLRLPGGRTSAVSSARRKKVKLKRRTATFTPGKPLRVKLKIPRSIARRYAGRTLRATITVTARDSAGNVKKATAERKVKLAKRRRG
jgi:hypothetical protein